MTAIELLSAWPGPGVRELLLALDYDGTLTPIVERPEDASPDGELGELLEDLLREPDIDVVVLSGRPVRVLASWLPQPGLLLVGAHGAEWRPPGESRSRPFLAPPEAREAAGRAARDLAAAVDGIEGSQVEPKDYGVAAHYRRVPARLRGAWRSRLDEAARNHCPPFGAHQGKCVVELRWPGVDKGRALGELKRRLGRAEAAVLALGDDESDEATFATMSSRDLSVHVGPGPSGARACLADPAAARALLRELIQRRRQGR